MTKPTGRPRGRPKTKEYITLMARFPLELADRLHAYGKLRRLSLSEVLREGAEALLSADDILSYMYKDVSDMNRDMSDMNGAVVPARLGDIPDVSPGYDYVDELERVELTPPAAAYVPELQDTPPAPAILPVEEQASREFDASKYILGEICVNGHDYDGTGQSLRRLAAGNPCLECTAARTRAYRQRKHQAQPVHTLVLEGAATGVGGSREEHRHDEF